MVAVFLLPNQKQALLQALKRNILDRDGVIQVSQPMVPPSIHIDPDLLLLVHIFFEKKFFCIIINLNFGHSGAWIDIDIGYGEDGIASKNGGSPPDPAHVSRPWLFHSQ